MASYYSFLREVYFFKDLSDDDVQAVESLCEEYHFDPGAVVFEEGDAAERFFIVLDGEVEVWKDYRSESPDMLAVHGAGHLFGEMALIDELPRSATIVVRNKARLLAIGRSEFQSLLQERPSVSLSLLLSLSSMVRRSNESFVEDLRVRNRRLERALSDLKATQNRLLRAERFSNMGKFASMILHDIRNPVSILRGYAEMITMGGGDAGRAKDYAEKIVGECGRLNRLASDLLDYSRGEIRLNFGIVSVPNLLKKLKSNIAERFQARGLTIEIGSDLDRPVLVDEERLLRVLVNLADNARKAMTNGGVFSVTAQEVAGQLQILVKDTGEGMSEDVLTHVFEPFYSTAEAGGTGLGMVIVKNIVEAHGGELRVTSEPGKGTEVQITIPPRT